MSQDLGKRLAALQEQAEQNKYKSIRYSRALLVSFVLLSLFALVLRSPVHQKQLPSIKQDSPLSSEPLKDPFSVKSKNESDNTVSSATTQDEWFAEQKIGLAKRQSFLRFMPLGGLASKVFYRYSQIVVTIFALPPQIAQSYAGKAGIDPLALSSYGSSEISIGNTIANSLMRVGFVIIAFGPWWLCAGAIGFFAIRKVQKTKQFDPILGVCDRGKSPFYSGIYGPFRLNGDISGLELQCPGLACPAMVPKPAALSHKLTDSLKSFGALNETTLSLARVILAYSDFPCFVEEERPVEDDQHFGKNKTESASANTGVVTNKNGTILSSSLESLPALLQAHRLLKRYFATQQETDEFAKVFKDIRSLGASLPELAQVLLFSLTPIRAKAFAGLKACDIAAAYLATEAGKCLVYKKVETGYMRISNYPHLQARSILHSMQSYHQEYSGNTRLIIRQAIVCARRHGDFARSFLPENMPLPSRALRDILEIQFAPRRKRADIAPIVELDAHTDEVLRNWRSHYSEFVEQYSTQTERKHGHESQQVLPPLAKGIAYKSVLLMPQKQVIELALKDFCDERQKRISELMAHAGKFKKSLTVSARLPGFKRQIDEDEEAEAILKKRACSNQEEKKLFEQWLIVRRMLTTYNWLSTRVGDDAVPLSGLLHGIVVERAKGDSPEVVGFDAIVPLRQRRLRELLGPNWERQYYLDAPHPNDISIFIEDDLFKRELIKKMELAQKGLLDLQPEPVPQMTEV